MIEIILGASVSRLWGNTRYKTTLQSVSTVQVGLILCQFDDWWFARVVLMCVWLCFYILYMCEFISALCVPSTDFQTVQFWSFMWVIYVVIPHWQWSVIVWSLVCSSQDLKGSVSQHGNRGAVYLKYVHLENNNLATGRRLEDENQRILEKISLLSDRRDGVYIMCSNVSSFSWHPHQLCKKGRWRRPGSCCIMWICDI